MATATATRPAPSIADAYKAAILRARDEGLSAQRNADGTWTCKQYTLTFNGPRWHHISCDCKAGLNGRVCKHAALVVYARSKGVCRIAIKQPVKEVASPAIAESTPAEVAESDAIKADIIASLSDYPRGSRADIAQVEATADYYEEVARRNAAAYAEHTFVPGTRRIASNRPDPFADFGYGEMGKEAWL